MCRRPFFRPVPARLVGECFCRSDIIPLIRAFAAVHGHIAAFGHGADDLALGGAAGADVQAAIDVLDLTHRHAGSCLKIAHAFWYTTWCDRVNWKDSISAIFVQRRLSTSGL